MLVCWDSNLFIYLLEENPNFIDRVQELLQLHETRRDQVCTSHLALGEVMTGPRRYGDGNQARQFCDFILDSNVRILPFDLKAATIFSQIRATHRVSTPDAIHLACAAAERVDLFLTNDTHLPKLIIPGISRIANFNSDVFAPLLP